MVTGFAYNVELGVKFYQFSAPGTIAGIFGKWIYFQGAPTTMWTTNVKKRQGQCHNETEGDNKLYKRYILNNEHGTQKSGADGKRNQTKESEFTVEHIPRLLHLHRINKDSNFLLVYTHIAIICSVKLISIGFKISP